jgi:hypothetical protein
MARILLLDCSKQLERKLKEQGFDIETGTSGFCTGIRRLPSQLYEKDVIIYNPETVSPGEPIYEETIEDKTPEYNLAYLESRIRNGATFLVFLNPLSNTLDGQRAPYQWIPYMPVTEFTSDKHVLVNPFEVYPDSEWRMLAPIVTTENLASPVLQKLKPPKAQDYPRDIFTLLWNGHGDNLGTLILRGRGRLIILPRFLSNEDVIETFAHRVLPQLYPGSATTGLTERFISPEEGKERELLKKLDLEEKYVRDRQSAARSRLVAAGRAKSAAIKADDTAKQILVYWDNARRQDDAALFYLYKIVESIENKLGGEAAGIKTLGAGSEWKAVKKLANESYRDARHAPKPGDVIKKWSNTEIKQCFQDTEKVVMAYFASLFPQSSEAASE